MKHLTKKGQGVFGIGIAVLVIVLMLFAVGITANYMMTPLQEMKEDIVADDDMSAEAKEIITRSDTHYKGFWDGAIVFLFIMIWLANFIAAFFIDAHPVFFVITFLMLIFILIGAAIISNEYEAMYDDPALSVNSEYFVKTNWIMGHILEIGILIAISLSIPIFTKIF